MVGRLIRICFVSKNLGNPIIFTSMFYPEQESSFFKYFRMIQKANWLYVTLLRTCSAPPHSFEASPTTLLQEKDTLVTSQDTRSPVTHRKHWRLFVEWVRVVSSIFGYRLIPFSCVAELRIIALEIAFTLAQFFLRVEKRKCSPGQSESNGQSGSQCPPFCLLNLNRKIYLFFF